MEREELRIEISATSQAAIKEIAGTSTALQNLGTKGTASIDTITEALRRMRETRGKTFNPAELEKFNQAIRELEFNAKSLKDIGIRSDVGENARRARVAVYGLNQVVRDLPFGFIAISNNLPVLLDQFQSLVRETGSLKKGFAAFAQGLVGGAGISLAISAAISLVTSLVTQYGSLGNAYRALTGNINAAALVQEKFNAAFAASFNTVAQTAANIDLLNTVIATTVRGTEQHETAVAGLNAVLADAVPSFNTAEKAITSMDETQKKYVKTLLITQIMIKAYGAVIDEMSVKYAKAGVEGVQAMDKIKSALSIGWDALTGERIELFNLGKMFDERAKASNQKTIDSYYESMMKAIQMQQDKVMEFLGGGGKFKDIAKFLGINIDDGKKTADEAAKVYDELLKANIRYQKAAIDAASKYGLDKVELQRGLAAMERDLAKSEATRTIQDKKALVKELAAIDLEYRTKVAELTKLPLAEIDFGEAGRKSAERYILGFKEGLKKDKLTADDIGIDPEKLKKIEVPKWITDMNKAMVENARLGAEAYKQMVKDIEVQINLLSDIFDTLTSGVLEDFLTKGKAGFETLIQNVGKLAIKLAEAAIKALIIQKVTQALQMAGGGGGGIFAKIARMVAGGGTTSKIAGPAVVGMAAMTPQITTRISGNDLLVVLNRSMRTQGRIG